MIVTDFRLSQWLVTVLIFLRFLHRVDVDDIVDVSEILASQSDIKNGGSVFFRNDDDDFNKRKEMHA
jgi:hypothetical protein